MDKEEPLAGCAAACAKSRRGPDGFALGPIPRGPPEQVAPSKEIDLTWI